MFGKQKQPLKSEMSLPKKVLLSEMLSKTRTSHTGTEMCPN